MKLFILPKFLTDDKISLYLSSNISTLNGITQRQINEVYQEQPEVSQTSLTKSSILKLAKHGLLVVSSRPFLGGVSVQLWEAFGWAVISRQMWKSLK
ncbi:hypothetical protein [Aeromonas caviae]|uniref:hypothetical protein n=1 Tax=Aeromonas caviae TaxID=648 RepID=UPI0004D97A33|nr:hypothetical protein [Aeromonas caviae]KEP91357.1 hypothetical protein DA11_07915 [Aeromonas caviae]